MARLGGRNTEVTLKIGAGTAVAVPANNFSLDMSKDAIDATNFLDPNKVELRGIPALSGEISGFFDTTGSWILYSAALNTTDSITMTVTFDKLMFPNETISGPVALDASLSATVDGAYESSGSWSATGPWNLTNLTSAFTVVAATGATAGIPGSFTPVGASAPGNLGAMTGITASPATAWTTGQYVVLGDLSNAHWSGTAWVSGIA
jgi:hypothetical protein